MENKTGAGANNGKAPALAVSNLIKKDELHIHSELIDYGPPPSVRWDEELDDFVASYEEEYIEPKLKQKYTIEQLVAYFYTTCEIERRWQNEKRDRGGFEFLLKQGFALDTILFAIDITAGYKEERDRPIQSALDVSDYLDNAEAIIQERVQALEADPWFRQMLASMSKAG